MTPSPGSRGRPRAGEHRIATRERILRAAEDAFASHGFALADLAGIAAHAHVTRPGLLYHFRSKDELYRAALERALGRMSLVLARAAEGGGPFHAGLERLVRGFSRFAASDATAARLFVRAAIETGGPGRRLVRELTAPILDGVVAFVEAHADELPPGLGARPAVLQVVSGALLRAASGPLGPVLFGEGEDGWDVARFLFTKRRGRR